MSIDRTRLYHFPWSTADNPGAWIEVTDECNLECPGCYRHRLSGHRSLPELKEEILACRTLVNCDRIAIAGGEPLLYPDIVETVAFIARQGLKPMILSNGEYLTPELARALKGAGLKLIYLHVDSGQQRPGWQKKTEIEMNALRQHYADLISEVGGMQCGFNITVTRKTLEQLPAVVAWGRTNIHKVQHLSLIAFRGLPRTDEITYTVNGRTPDPGLLPNMTAQLDAIGITTDDMYELLEHRFPDSRASAYLGGTAVSQSNKFLIILNVGSRRGVYGSLGARTSELVQVVHHLLTGRYCAFYPKTGKRIFLLSLIDRECRKAFGSFLRAALRNPAVLFDRLHVQCINLQQPLEVLDGQINLCDGCPNMMLYQGRLINSCRLDEYRICGGPLVPRRLRPAAVRDVATPVRLRKAGRST
jgi:hypothetical protein